MNECGPGSLVYSLLNFKRWFNWDERRSEDSPHHVCVLHHIAWIRLVGWIPTSCQECKCLSARVFKAEPGEDAKSLSHSAFTMHSPSLDILDQVPTPTTAPVSSRSRIPLSPFSENKSSDFCQTGKRETQRRRGNLGTLTASEIVFTRAFLFQRPFKFQRSWDFQFPRPLKVLWC